MTSMCYLPPAFKLIRVASMESPSEFTETIAFFFRMLNEGMTEVAPKAIHFNPYGMLCDGYGPNHIAMKKVTVMTLESE